MNARIFIVPGLILSLLMSVLLVHASAASITQIGKASLYIFGVSTETNGSVVGVPALLTLTVTNGTGQVFLGSTPLTDTDTQAQAVVSTSVACQLVNVNCDDYNFYFYITSSSAEIGGPSAGAAFTVAAMSVLTGKPLSKDVAMTGTANPDGSIGLVGDVAEKSEAAAEQGIKIFLYPANEPSGDNMTTQALQYDENLGMVPIPITSVYQAYQYFTGYNASPPLNYSIYTGLYNSLMEKTFVKFNNYQNSLYSALPEKTSTNSSIENLITTALSSIQYQGTLAAQGNYYVASSDIVNTSATDLLYADLLEQFSTSSNPARLLSNLISTENSSISQTYNNVTSDYLTNSSTLDLKFIAIDRLNEASSFLNQSVGALAAGDLTQAAYWYSLAEIKRASSIFWVSVLPLGTSNFSQSSYYNLSNYYLYKAASFDNYATLLGSASAEETDDAQNYLTSAQNYQNSGQYVASIFSSLQTIATSELIIEENSIITNSSESQFLNQISVSALRDIDSAESAGVTPFLGISYYQFGNSFSNSSLAEYIEFESLSRTYTDFEKNLANISSIPFSQTLQPISVPLSATYQDILYVILGFAFGVVISGLLFEYKLFRLVRNKSIKLNNLTPQITRRKRTNRRHRQKNNR